MPGTRKTPGEGTPLPEEKPAEALSENMARAERAAEDATAAVESFAVRSVAEIAKLSREAQAAAFDDARTALLALEQATRAKSLADAAHIHIDFVSGLARANVERARAVTSYLANKIAGGREKAGLP